MTDRIAAPGGGRVASPEQLVAEWRDEARVYRAAAKDQFADHDAAGAHVNCRRADDADRHAKELAVALVVPPAPQEYEVGIPLVQAVLAAVPPAVPPAPLADLITEMHDYVAELRIGYRDMTAHRIEGWAFRLAALAGPASHSTPDGD